MVDNDLLQAAINAYLKIDRADRVIDEAMAAAIEAYEAAKPSPWRPIEEAPRDGSTMQFWSEKLKRPFPLFATWEDADWAGPGFRVGSVVFPLGSAHLRGAMFRTIDPPTQDAAQGAER